MIKKQIYLKEIISFLGKMIVKVLGDTQNVFIDNLADVEHTNSTTLDWIIAGKSNKQEIAENSKAKVLLVDPSVEYSESIQTKKKVLLVVENPKFALAKIGREFFMSRQVGIHPTAIIDQEAIIGENVYIGAYTVIGKANIGNNCIIESNVRIYDDVVIGHNCVVKPGAIIGGEGFGFERDENGNRFRFPQIGGVKIGNSVEIGGNTCIDRGALSDTEINDYTKINNCCHVAHNNKIGKNVVIAAEVNVSGSNIIDDNVWIAPSASIRGYVHIGERSVVGMGAVVVKDIPSNETWVGNPAKKLK